MLEDKRIRELSHEIERYEKFASNAAALGKKDYENTCKGIAESYKAQLMVEMAKYLKK